MPSHLPSQHGLCPTDILLLIFQELHCIAPDSLRNVRLVSRKFHDLVEPLVYRDLKLTKALLRCFEDEDEEETHGSSGLADARRRMRSAISTFTRHVIIDRRVSWPSVINMLLSLKKFHHLSCYFRRKGHYQELGITPQSVFDTLAANWPNATYSVHNVNPGLDAVKVKFSPANLVLLELGPVYNDRDYGFAQWLKDLLLQCDQLKELRLLNVPSGTRFPEKEIQNCQRLPALEALFLEGYFWLHSPKVATGFWNWSRLTSLRLEKVFIINFLESVPPEQLLQLKSLITDGHCESAVDYTKVSILFIKYF